MDRIKKMPLLRILLFKDIDRTSPFFLLGFLLILGICLSSFRVFVWAGGFILIFYVLLFAFWIKMG